MTAIPLIGIDLGYGEVKIAGPGFRKQFPAVVADAGIHAEPSGLVSLAGRQYLVGEPALADPSHRYASRMDKIATEDELARYCAALALASDHYDTDTFIVATGLPPSHWRDEGLKAQVQHRLSGTFSFYYEGRSYRVYVPSVTVDPQAGAAFYDYLLHDDGDLARADLLQMKSLVLDIGHNTTDIAMFHGRKSAFGRDSLKTAPKGVWHVYEEMQRLILRDLKLPLLSAAAVGPIWRSGGLKLGGEWTSIQGLKPGAAQPIARAIMAEIERAANDLRLWDALLVTGGGAHVLGPHLQFPSPVVTTADPSYGNAAGYFKRQMERLRT